VYERKGTQMTGVIDSVCWPRLCLAPFVIDQTEESAGNKKINRSNGCGEKWDVKIYCLLNPTPERYAACADGLGSRVD
jgi:hypothetical protein